MTCRALSLIFALMSNHGYGVSYPIGFIFTTLSNWLKNT